MSAPTISPTVATYAALERAFDHFNAELFGASLPPCLLTLRSSPRTHGYMHRHRFVNIGSQQVDELGINPGYFAIQTTEEVLSTIAHEMVHHWQNHCGSPSKSLPHNREWAEKMESVGLMPSHTGLPGGKRTGRTMSDYMLPDGAFIQSAMRLIEAGFHLPWLDSHVSMAPEKMQQRRAALADSGVAVVGGEPPLVMASSQGLALPINEPAPRPETLARERYVCPQCGIRAWAAPETLLECGTCGVPLASQQTEGMTTRNTAHATG
jgi:hypothetical protein